MKKKTKKTKTRWKKEKGRRKNDTHVYVFQIISTKTDKKTHIVEIY